MIRELQIFTRELLELNASLAGAKAPPEAAAAAPGPVTRALIAVRLLAAQADQQEATPWQAWLQVVRELLDWLGGHPARFRPPLSAAVNRLIPLLERMLGWVDDGRGLAELDLGAELADLRQHFALPADDRPGKEMAGAGRRVLLLVGGVFRAGLVRQRLQEAGWSVVACSAPVEAAGLLGGAEPFAAVIGDDVEPVRNLRRLAEILRGRGLEPEATSGPDRPTAPPPLVLLTGISTRESQQWARKLGAVGVWGSPYRVTDLVRLFPDQGWISPAG